MAFEKVGVQLEAKDWQKFVNALGLAGRAITQLNKTFARFAQDVSQSSKQAEKSTKAYTDSLASLARKGSALFQVQERIAEQEIQDLLEVAKLRDLAVKQQEDAADATTDYTRTLIALARQASLLPGTLGKVAAALARVAAKTASVGKATTAAGAGGLFGKIATGLSAAVGAIGAAISAMSGGTLIAIGVAAAAFVGFIATVKLAGKVLGKLLSVVSTVAKGIASLFTKVLSTAVSLLVSGVRTAIDAITSVVSTAFSALGKIAGKVADIGMQLARAAGSFIQEAATMAGRFNELELAAVAMARGVGISDEAVLGAIKAVNVMNIRYDVAAASVARMVNAQIDMKYATDLARVAQAIAIITNRDSSEELTSLTHALTTGNVQMLRRHHIIVDNDVAERNFAEANNLTVKSLTARQKIEAQVQEVIKQSAHLMGVYEAAMRSGSKIMRSIEGRLIPEFVAAMGGPMQGAYSEVARAAYDFLEALTASIREGGRFYPTMVKIGAVLQIVGEAFSDLVRKAASFFEAQQQLTEFGNALANLLSPAQLEAMGESFDKAADDMNDWASRMAVAAFKWGAEIMVQFADGIIAGIGYIAQAMVQVAGALASWLAAFSPPKVAPDIAKWGAAAMAEYLRGFAMVDYGAFEGIQKVLGRLLGGPELAGLLGEIIESMATGTVGEDLFARIAAATGAFGAEIVKLTKLQFKYAEALRAVTAAQLALTRAQDAVKGHSTEVDKLVREYNKLLRAGAGDELLDTRLEGINAEERARNAAIIERDQAQESVKLAEARLDPIKEALALQEKLVDVLLDLATAQADVVEKTKKAAKGGADAIIEEFARAGARIGEDFQTNMQKAIDKIKGGITQQLKNIFQPVWDAILGDPQYINIPTLSEEFPGGQTGFRRVLTGREGGIVGAAKELADAWVPLWEEIQKVWAQISSEGGLIEALKSFSGPAGTLAEILADIEWGELVTAIKDVKWDELATAIGNLASAVGEMLGISMPEGGADGALGGIVGALERFFLGEEVTVPLPGEQYAGGPAAAGGRAGYFGPGQWGGGPEMMTVRLLAPFELLTIAINDKLIPAIEDFTEKIEGITETLGTIREVVDRIGKVMDALGIGRTGEDRRAGTSVMGAGSLLGFLEAGQAALGDTGTPIGTAIGEAIVGGINAFISSVSPFASVRDAIMAAFKLVFRITNPARAMEPIGVSIGEGIASGMILPDSTGSIFTSMQFIADEMLAAVGPDVTSPLADTVVSVGEAFTILIAKGIKENVGRIIGALDEAMRSAREHLAQLGWEAGQRSGVGDYGQQDQQQQGGYSPRGGIHHPGEYIIPAGLTRALMQPVSRTSNVQIGPNNISQGIDEAYFMARVRNMIRREVASAH